LFLQTVPGQFHEVESSEAFKQLSVLARNTAVITCPERRGTPMPPVEYERNGAKLNMTGLSKDSISIALHVPAEIEICFDFILHKNNTS